MYIKLAIVKKRKVSRAEADEFTRLTLQGDIDQILHEKEQIEMEQILKESDKTRLVLVEGAPGIGKSTLAWELCRQWENMESLKRFSLIVLLRLREEWVQNSAQISDLFYHSNPQLSKSVGLEVEKREGEGVLFIFDGYDEFPREICEGSLVMKIIRGIDYLPQATVLVTSRPSATAQLHSFLRSNIDKRIEIVGFSQKEIHQYAYTNLEGTNLYHDFIEYLSVNPAIKGLMYNPLNCAIIVEAYRESHKSGRLVPHTQTQLYEQLALYRISRYLSARGETAVVPSTLKEINNKHNTLFDWLKNSLTWLLNGEKSLKEQLISLGELAFHGRVNEEIIFKELPDGCSMLGLLMKHTSLYGRNENVMYTFLHLTLQEYLAAFYISELPIQTQQQHFANYHHLKHMNVVWRFFAGLTKMQIGWSVFKGWTAAWLEGSEFYTYDYKLNESTVIVQPFIIQCLYEAQDVNSCENVFGSFKVKYPEHVFNPYHGITNYDVFGLGFCVSMCRNVWSVNLKLTDLDLDMLGHGMNAVKHGGGYIDNFDLWGSYLAIKECGNLLQMPSRIIERIETLNLRGCGIDNTGIKNLARRIPDFKNLKSLNISYNQLDPGSTIALLKALEVHGMLEELHYRGLVIGMDEVYALSTFLQSSKNMRRLSVGESYTRNITFSPEVLSELMKVVFSSSSLQSIYIRTNPDTRPLDHIESISKHITTLQFTSFYEVSSLNDEHTTSEHEQPLNGTINGGVKFAKILRKNKSLKELWLELSLDSDEVHSIVESLKENTSLERLVLYKRRHSQYFSKSEIQTMDSRVTISMF